MKLIIDNENKKLSRNGIGRIDRKNKINNDLKLLFKKSKSEKKKKQRYQ